MSEAQVERAAYRRGYWDGREVGLAETTAMGEIATLREQVAYWKHRYEVTLADVEKGDDARVLAIDPVWIKIQRELGWPNIHPEDFCHKCGHRNPIWCAPAEEWRTATASWATETGREGICCPACFAEMYEEATGASPVWVMMPWRGSWDAHAPARLADVERGKG